MAAVLDAAPFPIWQRDRSLNIKWVNKAFVKAVEEQDIDSVVSKSVELDHGGKDMARRAAEEIDLGHRLAGVVVPNPEALVAWIPRHYEWLAADFGVYDIVPLNDEIVGPADRIIAEIHPPDICLVW